MRTLILIFILLSGLSSQAQQPSVKTVTIQVSGDCDECKATIENAADIKGVKVCNWDKKTKTAVVTFDESKVSQDKIEQAIAAKGYDTEHYKASDASYNKLPKCCRYKGNTDGLHKQ